MTKNCNNPLLHFFLNIAFFAIIFLLSYSANLSAQGALQLTAHAQNAGNSESFIVMWVILGIWCAVSLYIIFIDRKISSLEKKHKK